MIPRCLLVGILWFPAVSLCGQSVTLTVDATQDLHAIPAEVYGVNDIIFAGATVNRHGGDRLTGFNWENNASNAGSDYNQESDDYLGVGVGIGASTTPGAVLKAWMDADRAAGLKTIMTLPLAGYVAADMNGPVAQSETAPSARWKQVVVNKGSAPSLPPDSTDGYVYLDEMVNYLTTNYGLASAGGVAFYNMDNEPALWPSTHPRIHPNATQYAELAAKNIAAATMVTGRDPGAQVYGPTLYGWEAYLNLQNAPDAGTYNNTYGIFANYYLAQMQAASTSVGRRLLHRFDMHWYPEATGDNRIVFGSSPGTNNDIDARLQAPRSLWDPAYVEKSWITQYTTNGGGIQLLPRLQGNINQYYPGTGIALSEYDYGATDHISGGVAEADVLGILGDYQAAGNFWPVLSDSSYVGAAFALYRNYDGAGSAYGTLTLAATASDNSAAGVHAARVGSGGTKLTVVAVNRSRTATCAAQVNFTLPGGQSLSAVKTYRLTQTGGAQVLADTAIAPAASGFADTLPAMSATLYEVQLATAVTSYSTWQTAVFGSDASNPAVAGPSADPDHDGVPNLLEYILARNPKASDATPPLSVTRAAQSVTLQFNRRKSVSDVTLHLLSAGSLTATTWTEQDPATLNPTITSIDSQTERWTITLSVASGTSQSFYRLKAQQ